MFCAHLKRISLVCNFLSFFSENRFRVLAKPVASQQSKKKNEDPEDNRKTMHFAYICRKAVEKIPTAADLAAEAHERLDQVKLSKVM